MTDKDQIEAVLKECAPLYWAQLLELPIVKCYGVGSPFWRRGALSFQKEPHIPFSEVVRAAFDAGAPLPVPRIIFVRKARASVARVEQHECKIIVTGDLAEDMETLLHELCHIASPSVYYLKGGQYKRQSHSVLFKTTLAQAAHKIWGIVLFKSFGRKRYDIDKMIVAALRLEMFFQQRSMAA